MTLIPDTLPSTLFLPLAAPGAAVYLDILLDIFQQTRARIDPLPRESVADVAYRHITEPGAYTLTDDAQEDSALPDEETDRLAIRANWILRYLERCGWLRIENQRGSAFYILPDYAFRLLRTLHELEQDEPPPLAGQIFATYAVLQNVLADPASAYIGIVQAHRQTQQLLNGLKELQQNIGLHINRLLAKSQTRDILAYLLVTYQQEIVDRSYHQLRTTDHLSRWRPGVIDLTAQIEGNANLIEQAAHRLHQQREASSVEAARQHLVTQLYEIRTQFEDLDRLIEAIDTRHSQFVEAAVRAIGLRLSAQHTTSGQLHQVLQSLLALPLAQRDELAQPLVELYTLAWLGADSLAASPQPPQAFVPEATAPDEVSPDEIEQARQDTARRLQATIDRDQIREYAERLLGKQPTRRVAEIEDASPETLLWIIYLRYYGLEGSLGYQVSEPGDWIDRGDIAFHDFAIEKKSSHEPD